MNFYIGVTDRNWYEYLKAAQADEVNFWQPGGTTGFHVLNRWEPFLFKLKSPVNAVAGVGFFVRHTFLPLDIAWKTFGQKNGAADFQTFSGTIRSYRAQRGSHERNPTIGCIILTDVVFFPEELWTPQPDSWSRNIVSGKGYSTEEPEGRAYWERVAAHLRLAAAEKDLLLAEEPPRYTEQVVRRRLGQGGFRVEVIEAYQRRCAVTGERTLPVLEAAHIKPYAESGPHDVRNGLLLRADLHNLFDSGLVTVTPDYRLEVSRQIKEQYENGRVYYGYHGQKLAVLPENELLLPSQEFIDWHNNHVFTP